MGDENKLNPWMTTASNAAGGLIGGAMGMMFGGIENKRQIEQQKKLNDLSYGQHMKFTDYSMKKQMEMWEATNYKAQMEQLQKAGLNPGLMYEGGGPGGSLQASTGGGGSSQASRGSEGVQGMGMGLQLGMMNAQMKLIEAQTKKTEVETAKTAGVDTENVQANTANTRIQTKLGEIQAEIQGESVKALKYIITGEAEKLYQEVNIMRNEGIISENTWSQKIDMVGQGLIGMTIENELKRSNIEVNQAQIAKWSQELINATKGLELEKRNTVVNEKLAEFNTSLSREALGAIGGIISTVIGKGMTKGTKITKMDIHKY